MENKQTKTEITTKQKARIFVQLLKEDIKKNNERSNSTTPKERLDQLFKI